MKLTVCVFLLTAATGSLFAQDGTSWVQIQGAYVDPYSKTVENSPGYGAGVGTWLNDRWGAELSLLTSKADLKNTTPGQRGSETHTFLTGLYSLCPGNAGFNPFLRAGAGLTQVGSPWVYNKKSNVANLTAGIGFQSQLRENFLFTFEAREVRVTAAYPHYETLGMMGLGYRWGGSRSVRTTSAPAAQPVAPKVEPAPMAPPPPPPPPPVVAEPTVMPPPPVQAPPPPPPPPAKIILDQAVLHFANGQNELSPEGKAAVKKVAQDLLAFKGDYTLVVTGYTSASGSVKFNKALSKRRADAVAKTLAEAGLPAASVTTVGAGPEQPIADNATPDGQAKNRRVEIEVKAKGAEVRTITTGLQETPEPKGQKAKSDIKWK